jgi:hypothetical protein
VELLPLIVFNGLFTVYPLALIHLFDNQARTALKSMVPALEMTGAEFDDFRYKLSTMPSRAPLAAGLAMAAFVVLMEQVSTVPFSYAALEQLPVFSVVYHIIDKGSGFMFAVIIYHTIRQLGFVNRIHSNHVRVNLFNLGPLQVFSRLTASTAVGLVIGVYLWMVINPELLADPINVGFLGIFTLLAVGVFVWPLYGAHRLMVVEKTRVLHDIGLQFEAAFAKLNRGLRDDDDAAVEKLHGILASLEIQHNRISAIPTWPWRPETARFALTAIALPLILSIVQFLVLQALRK